jgi:hypothetical protein
MLKNMLKIKSDTWSVGHLGKVIVNLRSKFFYKFLSEADNDSNLEVYTIKLPPELGAADVRFWIQEVRINTRAHMLRIALPIGPNRVGVPPSLFARGRGSILSPKCCF